MVQLKIISGKMAGDTRVVRHFPFHLGCAPENDFCLEDAGVWERHLIFEFQKNAGFSLQTVGGAFAAINYSPQTSARLRNGDIISFGSAKIQFWLAPVRQKSLALREICVWLLLAAVTVAQAALLWRLLRAG